MKKALIQLLIAGLTSVSMAAMAADTAPASPSSPGWLQTVKKSVEAKKYEEAITTLEQANATESADWHNLMGYSLRKKNPPDLAKAEKHYQAALDKDPKHRGALEYYGELLLLKKDLPGAQALLARLDKACTFGCEEYRDLKKSIQQYTASQ